MTKKEKEDDTIFYFRAISSIVVATTTSILGFIGVIALGLIYANTILVDNNQGMLHIHVYCI